MPSSLKASSSRLGDLDVALQLPSLADPVRSHPTAPPRIQSTLHLTDLRALRPIPGDTDLSLSRIDFFTFPTAAATMVPDAARPIHDQVPGGGGRSAAARLGELESRGGPAPSAPRPARAGRGRRRAGAAATRRRRGGHSRPSPRGDREAAQAERQHRPGRPPLERVRLGPAGGRKGVNQLRRRVHLHRAHPARPGGVALRRLRASSPARISCRRSRRSAVLIVSPLRIPRTPSAHSRSTGAI